MNKVVQKLQQSHSLSYIYIYTHYKYIKYIIYVIYQVLLKQAHSKRNFSGPRKTENV